MKYLENIRGSLRFILMHPKTWIWGFIMAFSTGSIAGLNFKEVREVLAPLFFDVIDKIELGFSQHDFRLVISLFFILLVVFLFWYLTILARANLVKLFQNPQKKKFTFKQVFLDGHKYVGKLFQLDLLILTIILIVFVLPLIGIVRISYLICLLPIFLIFSIVFLIILFGSYTNAQRLIVLDKTKSVLDSLKEGRRLFSKHFDKYFLSVLSLNGIGCFWQLLIASPLVALMAHSSANHVLDLYLNGMNSERSLLIFIIMNSIFYASIQGIYQAFSYTYWTKVVIDILKIDKEKNKKSK